MPHKDPEKRRAYQREYGKHYKRKMDHKAAYRRRREKHGPAYFRNQNLTRYGIKLHDYTRLYDEQRGNCAICLRPETTVHNGRLMHLSVDHDHETGRVRGLLCNNCNRGIGLLGDDLLRLTSAIAYLQKASKPKEK